MIDVELGEGGACVVRASNAVPLLWEDVEDLPAGLRVVLLDYGLVFIECCKGPLSDYRVRLFIAQLFQLSKLLMINPVERLAAEAHFLQAFLNLVLLGHAGNIIPLFFAEARYADQLLSQRLLAGILRSLLIF